MNRLRVLFAALAIGIASTLVPGSALAATGETWTSQVSAADNDWNSVAYGNGLFVAISSTGTGNRVMTSPDGITWTLRASAADNQWRPVTYGNGVFVAVSWGGTGNRVMTSGANAPVAPSTTFTTTRAKVKVTNRAVILTTRVTVPGTGRITQRASTRAGRRTTTRCVAIRRATTAATYTLTRTMGRAARAQLRRRAMRVSLRTTFTPTGGALATRTQMIRIARRPLR